MQSHTILTVVGSGNWSSDGSGGQPSFLLEYDGKKVLVDCGAGTVSRLHLLNVDPFDIDALVLTHFHQDHFGDAQTLALVRWARAQRGKTRSPLQIIGPPTLVERFHLDVAGCSAEELFRQGLVELTEASTSKQRYGDAMPVGEFIFQPFTVNHVPDMICFSWRVKTPEGMTIVFSGDAGPDQDKTGFRQALAAADVAILEAGALTPDSVFHLTVEGAIAFAQAAKVKKLFFNHLDLELRRRAEEVLTRGDESYQRMFETIGTLKDGDQPLVM